VLSQRLGHRVDQPDELAAFLGARPLRVPSRRGPGSDRRGGVHPGARSQRRVSTHCLSRSQARSRAIRFDCRQARGGLRDGCVTPFRSRWYPCLRRLLTALLFSSCAHGSSTTGLRAFGPGSRGWTTSRRATSAERLPRRRNTYSRSSGTGSRGSAQVAYRRTMRSGDTFARHSGRRAVARRR